MEKKIMFVTAEYGTRPATREEVTRIADALAPFGINVDVVMVEGRRGFFIQCDENWLPEDVRLYFRWANLHGFDVETKMVNIRVQLTEEQAEILDEEIRAWGGIVNNTARVFNKWYIDADVYEGMQSENFCFIQ